MTLFNQKDLRIKKLWEKGMRDKAQIAKKIGYSGPNIGEGIRRVTEGLERTIFSYDKRSVEVPD